MQIDWFTFVAQIINFLILMGLLWKFLYQPIMGAMDQREEEIESRFQEAESKRKEAEEKARTYQQKQDELDAKRDEMLSEARESAEQEKKRLLSQAREEVDQARDKWMSSLRDEQESVLNRFREEAGKGLCSGVRRALQDLADEDLEPHITDVFLQRIASLDGEQRQALQDSLDRSDEPPQVVSAFELPQKRQKEISQAVKKAVERDVSLQFRQSSDVVCGVELRTDGHKLAWSVASFTAAVEENLSDYLAQQRQSDTQPDGTSQGDQSESAADHEQDEQHESE